MTGFEWVAVVGAAAWIPQIAVLVYRFAVRPKLHFLPVARGELTFNALGTIFNVRAAIIVQRKEVVVSQMRLELAHDAGREIVLEWDSYVEQVSELRTAGGERNEWSRDQQATALKVSPVLPTEKFFRFQDPKFKTAYQQASNIANDLLSRVPPSDEPAMQAFLRSPEYTELLRLYTTGFPWEPGKYNLTVVVRILGDSHEYRGRTSIMLSSANVDHIRRNVPLIEARLEAISRGVASKDLPNPSKWVEPSIPDRTIELVRSRSGHKAVVVTGSD